MDLPMPRIFADQNARAEAAYTAKEVGAVALGVTLFAVGFAGLAAVLGAPKTSGGA